MHMEQENPNHLFDCWTRKHHTFCKLILVCTGWLALTSLAPVGHAPIGSTVVDSGYRRGLLLPVYAQSADEMNPAAQNVAASINQTRTAMGLQPLVLQPVLIQAAQTHAFDMVNNHNYSHYGSDGSSVNDRVHRLGYATEQWASENWVAVADPARAIQWWMNSPVHRDNILNPNWHGLGVGSAVDGNGQHIFVAVFGTDSNAAPVVQAAAQPASPPAELPTPQFYANQPGSHTVQPGDTLLSIAIQHGTTWETLAQMNGLDEASLLQIGQQIRLPAASKSSPAFADASPETFTAAYIVQTGDTLFSIGGKLGISWETLAAANGLHEGSVLQIGQTLRAPQSNAAPPQNEATITNLPPVHTVADGETIITIAMHYGLTDWKALLALNGLAENTLLQPGQQIRLR
ncbi:MAG: LysM peptidoglycan-binding domain-containing protein [Caldilineaceae bacterium]